jgi:hypothetical protein
MVMHADYHAAKEHKCAGCPRGIKVGELHAKVTIPPWEDYDGDVDDEGRPIAYLLPPSERRWHILRFHLECEGY